MTLLISRPKEKERFYDESNFKIIINGKLAAKLGQGEKKEIEVDCDKVELQVKSRYGRSEVNLELEGRTELEIVRNSKSRNLYLVVFLFPIVFNVLYNLGVNWVKVLAAVLTVLLFGWLLYLYLKDRKTGIVITQV